MWSFLRPLVDQHALSSQERPFNTSKHEIFKFFFYFCGSFLPSWIRIRFPNPDPLTRLNPDPIWIQIRIRIRNPGDGDADLAFHLDADLDPAPAFHCVADPDPASQKDADPDPQQRLSHRPLISAILCIGPWAAEKFEKEQHRKYCPASGLVQLFHHFLLSKAPSPPVPITNYSASSWEEYYFFFLTTYVQQYIKKHDEQSAFHMPAS